MAKRNRKVGSVATELVKKAREAMLTAVQIYNNPQIEFKSELFIVTTVVAWTYLMHAYYRKAKFDYRQVAPNAKGKRKKFLYTKYGAVRHWSLEECLAHKACQLDKAIVRNLMFLIGIRHEIEHQMTTRIDDQLSAKFMAAALNFNATIKKLFDRKYSLETEQAFSIQFSAIDETTAKTLMAESDLPQNIKSFVVQFETGMSQEDYDDPRFSYRIAIINKLGNNKNTSDKVVQMVPPGSDVSNTLNQVILKATERTKFRPGTIVKQMKAEGYTWFTMHTHTELWHEKDAKNPKHQYGVEVEGAWYWYEAWLQVVQKYCQEKDPKMKPVSPMFPVPDTVQVSA